MPYSGFGDCYGMHGFAWEEASTASGGENASLKEGSAMGDGDWRTTVMLRNLPNTLNRDKLRQTLDDMGFCGQYDLVYLPVDFSTGAGLGYAFINVTLPCNVTRIWESFDGISVSGDESDKVCTV